MAADTIKDYLVGLGFSVDEKTYNAFTKKLNESAKEVEKAVGKTTLTYLKAGSVVISMLAGIVSATAAVIDKTAQADLQYKKLGLRMFMNNELAKQFKISTDALGESLDDIAWMPELRERYFALMKQSGEMKTPHDADEQLKHIRDIRFEFTRMKIEANYAMQWISYYLIKNLREPLNLLQNSLKNFNSWITSNMPNWTGKLSAFLTIVFKLAISAARAVFDLGRAIRELWDRLHPAGQAASLAAGFFALGAVPVIGPFLQACIVAGGVISSVLLLIDDFYGYLEGKKSSKTMAPVWKMLLGLFKDISSIIREINKLFNFDNNFFKTSDRFERFVNNIKLAANILTGTGSVLTIVFKLLIGLVDTLAYLLEGKLGKAKDRFKEVIQDAKDGWKDLKETAKDGAGVNTFFNKVKEHESGGNYRIINRDSGAMGAYQIMPSNWRNWSKEAGLGPNAPTTAENQDIVARFKLQQYINKYGDERLAAVAWYKGEGTADSIRKGKPSYGGKPLDLNKKFGKYDSINDYVYAVTGQTFGTNGLDYLANGLYSYKSMYDQSLANQVTATNNNGMTIKTEIGDITVYVAKTNASTGDIYEAVVSGVNDATTNGKVVRQLRDATGMFK